MKSHFYFFMSFKSQGSSRRAPVRTPHTPAAARPGGSREPGTQPGLFPWAAGPANAAVTCCLQEARRVMEQLVFPCRDWTAGPRCRPQITFYYLLHLTRLRKTGILSCFKCLHFVRRRSSCLLVWRCPTVTCQLHRGWGLDTVSPLHSRHCCA